VIENHEQDRNAAEPIEKNDAIRGVRWMSGGWVHSGAGRISGRPGVSM
jgi:hypothetical protein